jgi:hypothetical protein
MPRKNDGRKCRAGRWIWAIDQFPGKRSSFCLFAMLAFRQLANALQRHHFYFDLPSSNRRRKFGFWAGPAPDASEKSSSGVQSPRCSSEIGPSGGENRDIAHIAPRSRIGKNRDVARSPGDPHRSAWVRRRTGWDRAGAIPVTADGSTAGSEPATLRASV